jgi:hypothetical protein
MPELYEVSTWMDALKASPLFPVALPVILATVLLKPCRLVRPLLCHASKGKIAVAR